MVAKLASYVKSALPSTTKVLCVRNALNVICIDAMSCVAGMVTFQARRNRAVCTVVGKDMSGDSPTRLCETKGSISLWIAAPHPEVTARGRVNKDLGIEALIDGARRWSAPSDIGLKSSFRTNQDPSLVAVTTAPEADVFRYRERVSMTIPAEIVSLAPASGEGVAGTVFDDACLAHPTSIKQPALAERGDCY